MLTAWLLLLLRDGESYGLALFRRLADNGISVEATLGYRALRALERDGAITSRWTESDAGPQRRSYYLTAEGRHRLTELAATIAATCQSHERFIDAHERARARRQPTGSEQPAADELLGPSQQPNGDHHAVHGGRRVRVSGTPAPSHDAATAAVSRVLLAGWLLLLLEQATSYGYGLRRALEDHHVCVDPGGLYRMLRRLERDGWLQSHWMRPAAGPRRRFYRLTAKGRASLDDLVGSIAATRDEHGKFLHAYERTPGKPRRLADEEIAGVLVPGAEMQRTSREFLRSIT